MAPVSADAGLSTHGGLTPAAPGRMYVCASQKSLFRRQTSAHQHKSGGRKPPVAPMHAIVIRTRMTHIRFRRYVSPVALINANATAIRTHPLDGLLTNGAGLCGCGFVHPRRADVRRSLLSLRSSPNIARLQPHSVRFCEPRRADARRSWLSLRSSSNIARLQPHSVRFCEPRRADARRSWSCTTPHCESRMSRRTNVVQPGAAGVSQPWRTNTTAPAISIPTAG
jgi:hypothetical protein